MSDVWLYIIYFFGLSLIGIICLAVGIQTWRHQRRKEAAERTLVTGEIVDILTRHTRGYRSRSVTYYVPVIAFRAGGREYRLENENGVSLAEKEKMSIGQSVDVLYDSDNPSHFHLASDEANEKGARSILLLGSFLVAGAAVLTVLAVFYPSFRPW